MLRLETVHNGEEGEEEVGGASGGATDHAEGEEVKEGEEVEGMGFVDGGEVMDLEAKAIEVVEGEIEVVEVAEEVTEALEVVEEETVVVEVTGAVEGATEVVEVGKEVVEVGTEVVEAIEVVEGATEVADRDEGAEDEANSPHPHLDLDLYPPTSHTQYDFWIDIPSAHCLIYLCIPSSLLKTTQFT